MIYPHNAYDHGIVTSGFDLEIRGDTQFPCIVLLCSDSQLNYGILRCRLRRVECEADELWHENYGDHENELNDVTSCCGAFAPDVTD